MDRLWWFLVLLAAVCLPHSHLPVAQSRFLNEWVAKIAGGLNQAHSVAKRHGFEVVGEMRGFEDHYVLRHADVPDRHKRSADHHTRRLKDDNNVSWAEQQVVRQRSKRGYVDYSRRHSTCVFNDPYLAYQWYMNCPRFGSRGHRAPVGVSTMRVEEAWNKGYSGRNVVVCIVDDGLEYTNADLRVNYDPYASYDFDDNDPDPMPRYDPSNENRHGTRCAGVVAMQADNGVCGAGVAFNSKIGGVRILDGDLTDRMEASAFSHHHHHVDIYSVSWGPLDNGQLLDGPRTLTAKSMETAIRKGRGGKGAIYVWASGDGGHSDDCNCDGYASTVYSISVNSASKDGKVPRFSEGCPSTLTTTYSSNFGGEGVVSTDLHNQCTTEHSGTSASAPMAAGIIALALEANPYLTWRDVQHLVVLTSKAGPLAGSRGWHRNAAGFCVNRAFGFGLMDAADMVDMAENWVHVPRQSVCEVTADFTSPLPKKLASGGEVMVTFTTDGCQGQENEVNVLEHVQFVFTVRHSRRGALSVIATSPSGTETQLLSTRPQDTSREGFTQWPLTSVHTWGENPAGVWSLRVRDEGNGGSSYGTVEAVRLILYGTKTPPKYPKDITCHLKGGPGA